MAFLKRIITAIAALLLIFWGGSGTQSNNLALQGTGFIALIVGLIILIIFGRMMWRAMGCLLASAIIGGIVLFILYAIGTFEDGLSGAPERLHSFLGQSTQGLEESEAEVKSSAPMLTENIKPVAKARPAAKQKKQGFNPLNYPAIVAPLRVVKGNVLQFYNGQYIKIYGIDSPELSQACANRQGRSYACGKQAVAWLKDWVGDFEVKCHVVSTDTKGNMVGVCFLGQYDIAAALVNAGWAVATDEPNNVYLAYEAQARQNKRGLWQGQFYKPQDWRNAQNKKAEIKIIKPSKKSSQKEGLFGF